MNIHYQHLKKASGCGLAV